MSSETKMTVLKNMKNCAFLPFLTARVCAFLPFLSGALQLVRRRNALHRDLMKDTQNDELRQAHRAARSEARRLDRKLRNEYFLRASTTTDQRKLWTVLNKVTGRTRDHSDPQVSAQALGQAFGAIVTDITRPDQLATPHGPQETHSFSNFQAVPIATTALWLSQLDVSKATGSDEIANIVLRQCALTLAPFLTAIFNKSLGTGAVPRSYKLSKVKALHKGGDVLNVSNYRPVSLLPATSRLLERALKVQVSEFLSQENLFPASQFGYRKNHSCEDALVLAVSKWMQAKTAHETTGVVMVDLSKAFDRVKHELLIEELFSLGFHGKVLQWFQSYLSDRRQMVATRTSMTDEHICTRGVPQGSVLGPLLFLLYLRNFSEILPTNVLHQEFADDIILYCHHCDPAVVTSSLSMAINSLDKWLNEHGLLLNHSKTQVMFIKPKGVQDVASTVTCHGKPLAIVNTVKYLGVLIDDGLKWTSHVQQVSTKVGKCIARLWRHSSSLSIRARRMWYISMAQSSITYASNAFSTSISQHLLEEFQKLAKSGIRAVFRLHNPVRTAPLLSRLHVRLPAFIFRKKTADLCT